MIRLPACVFVASACASLACAAPPRALAGASAPVPTVAGLLAHYQRAATDFGAPAIERVTTYGAVSGAGLNGAFHTWRESDRERSDQTLGPRSERTLRLGDRMWLADSDGDVRELTGLLARRARTQDAIDSGDFANAPDRCVYRGRYRIDSRAAYALDVAADHGETETLYLDAVTGLPLRLAYDDDDGRSTIDFSDWRTVAGHRFPFRTIVSDGDHAFDTVETTAAVDVQTPIDPAVFAAFVARRIEMDAPETLSIDVRDGHLFVPVRIAGRTFTFLIDSGAQNVLLDKRVAASLGLVPAGALEASGASRTGGLQVVRLDELDVGSGRLRDLVATTLDLGASTEGALRVDGILGYPFFASSLVRLDPARRTMTFGPPGAWIPAGERIPVEFDRAFPEAQLRLGTVSSGQFIIDTGNAAELLLYRPFVERHAGLVPFSQNARNSYGIGGSTPSYRSTLDELDIGSTPLYHVDTDVMQATRGAFADRFDAGNVGLGVLKNFVVTFDAPDGALYVERGDAFDDGRSRA